MDKLTKYRNNIKKLLEKYQSYSSSDKTIETEIIIDTQGDHYQLLNVGWEKQQRIFGCTLHFDIKNDKIWLQHNSTDRRVAEELVEMGVERNDIVLGFQPPYRRKFSDYARG